MGCGASTANESTCIAPVRKADGWPGGDIGLLVKFGEDKIESLFKRLLIDGRAKVEKIDPSNEEARELKSIILQALNSLSPDAMAKVLNNGEQLVSSWIANGASIGLIVVGLILAHVPASDCIDDITSCAISSIKSSISDVQGLLTLYEMIQDQQKGTADALADGSAFEAVKQLFDIEDQSALVLKGFKAMLGVLVDSIDALSTLAGSELRPILTSVQRMMGGLRDQSVHLSVVLSMETLGALKKLVEFVTDKPFTLPTDDELASAPIVEVAKEALSQIAAAVDRVSLTLSRVSCKDKAVNKSCAVLSATLNDLSRAVKDLSAHIHLIAIIPGVKNIPLPPLAWLGIIKVIVHGLEETLMFGSKIVGPLSLIGFEGLRDLAAMMDRTREALADHCIPFLVCTSDWLTRSKHLKALLPAP